MLKIIGYRYYSKKRKFDKFLELLNKTLSESSIDYEIIIYANKSLSDIGKDEKKLTAEVFDFSAYLSGIKHFNDQPSTPKSSFLFFNDTFIMQWPSRLILKRFICLINKNLFNLEVPFAIGRVEKSCNISSKLIDSMMTATHFFLLNHNAVKYLEELIQNANNINQYIPNNHLKVLEALTLDTSYFHNYKQLDPSHPKMITIKIEMALGIYIYNNGFMLDIFNSFYIRMIHRLKRKIFMRIYR